MEIVISVKILNLLLICSDKAPVKTGPRYVETLSAYLFLDVTDASQLLSETCTPMSYSATYLKGY